ncbi:MAG: hypothetical protein JSV99_11370 [Planctomycetota bacterium]|nr:MAG: hypothetical protein JSV99_11370 [Planctomycetota bacterium]
MRATKLLVFICCFALSGCSVVEYFKKDEPPFDEELAASYHQTRLKESSSADVLTTIHRPEYEVLSQSKSVAASAGQKKKGYQMWFNMVAFDENRATAERKYFFVVDERGKDFLFGPKRSLQFDCQTVLESDILDEPYANENARRIAMLQQLLKNFRADIDELAQDNKTLDICGMLVNQTLQTVLQKLEASPSLASKLSAAEGMDFDHITLGKGRISMMSVTDEIMNVNVGIGSLRWTFEDPFALEE